ncbi:hypothetical protein [Sporosarcina sp. FSL K6-1508]|uniref:hypothetical protein n=1 Tax=Sporosarcina sp. FSL K6-1508 TaxID=2921553 RepID=UPI0030F4B87D
MLKQNELLAAIQQFPRMDNTISIWDHPNFKSSIALPDDYRPLTRTEDGLELMNRRRLNEEHITVLKVVGDAICANENQLRRYLSQKFSPSITSRHLKLLGKFGLVERHKCRLAFIEEDGKEVIRPPGPHTLGIGGFKLMNHLYGECTFTSPDIWQQNSMAVQRHVAMNEIRCLAVESGNVRGWSWYPYVGGNAKFKKPFATMRLETGIGELQMLIDRAQMSQNFIGYFRMRLEEYRYLYERDQVIIIDGFEKTSLQQIVALSVSSVSMASFIQEQLRLHTYPFDIWFIIDEWFSEEKGLEGACAQVTKEGIHRRKVAVLRKK